MKKILSLALAVSMLVSAVPMAYAADTQDYTQGTQVTYTAENLESYTITVPAKLAPGDTGTVTAKGTWPSTKNLRVTADESIEMVNSISTAANKELDITFEPIILAGSQTAEVSTTADITVEDITDALFGTWSGTINYNVDYVVVVRAECVFGSGRIGAGKGVRLYAVKFIFIRQPCSSEVGNGSAPRMARNKNICIFIHKIIALHI